jgi:hypothetical protein
VAQLYSQALSSLVVASYDLQGYGGDIRPRLHTGVIQITASALMIRHVFRFSRYTLHTDSTEKTVPLAMWLTWYHVFHCNDTVRLATDRVETTLPTAFLLLCDVTGVAQAKCLPSPSLATVVSLAPLFCLSGVMS